MGFNDFLLRGLVEYLDVNEENNSLIALYEVRSCRCQHAAAIAAIATTLPLRRPHAWPLIATASLHHPHSASGGSSDVHPEPCVMFKTPMPQMHTCPALAGTIVSDNHGPGVSTRQPATMLEQLQDS